MRSQMTDNPSLESTHSFFLSESVVRVPWSALALKMFAMLATECDLHRVGDDLALRVAAGWVVFECNSPSQAVHLGKCSRGTRWTPGFDKQVGGP